MFGQLSTSCSSLLSLVIRLSLILWAEELLKKDQLIQVIQVHVHACTCYMYVHVYMYVCNICMYVIYVCMYVCIYVCMYVCMYVHVCMYVCMYVCNMYVSLVPRLLKLGRGEEPGKDCTCMLSRPCMHTLKTVCQETTIFVHLPLCIFVYSSSWQVLR